MNNSAYFDNLIISLSLIRNKSVIPSLLDFQTKLQENIQNLIDEFRNKHYCETLIDAFCRLTCLVLDSNIENILAASQMHWRGYELKAIFYQYDEQQFFTTLHEERLLTTQNSEIGFYSKILLAMSPNPKINKGLATATFKTAVNINILNKKVEKIETVNNDAIVQKKYFNPNPILPESRVDPKFNKSVIYQLVILIGVLIILWLVGYASLNGGVL